MGPTRPPFQKLKFYYVKWEGWGLTTRPPSTITESLTTLPNGVFEKKSAHLFIFKLSHQCTQGGEERARSLRQVNLQVAEPRAVQREGWNHDLSNFSRGHIFTLSYFDKFYMVSTFLDATNAMVMSVSPTKFCIFCHFPEWSYKTPFCK